MPNISSTFRLIWIDYTFIVYDYMHKLHTHILQIIYAIQCNFIHMAQFDCFSFFGAIDSIINMTHYVNSMIFHVIQEDTHNPAKYINVFQIYRNAFSCIQFLCCVYLLGSHEISCNPTTLSHKNFTYSISELCQKQNYCPM